MKNNIQKILERFDEAWGKSAFDTKGYVRYDWLKSFFHKELSSLIREGRKSIRKAFFNHQEVDLGENRSCTKCNRRLCICPEREPDGSINLEKK